MTEPLLSDMTAAAEAYEQLHVNALFRVWADPVLDAAEVVSGQHVVDVACGTGILARTALARVGPDGSVSGLDANPGMLAVAGRIEPAVTWTEGLAEDLPFDDARFDAVVSQFGLMFFTDRVGAIREMLRVLRPGGTLAVAVWDGLRNQPAYATEVAILDDIGGSAAGDALRAPFALGDTDELRTLFTDAGVASPTVVTENHPARFPSIRSMVEADLRGWLPVMGVELEEGPIAEILAAADVALGTYVEPSGAVVFDSPGHIVVATKT